MPRPDLSSPLVDVVEWRLRGHDNVRLAGLRGQSPFHPCPGGAWIRQVDPMGELEVSLDAISEGRVDFVFRVPPGRRLEDRVLDVLRVWQAARHGERLEDAVLFQAKHFPDLSFDVLTERKFLLDTRRFSGCPKSRYACTGWKANQHWMRSAWPYPD